MQFTNIQLTDMVLQGCWKKLLDEHILNGSLTRKFVVFETIHTITQLTERLTERQAAGILGIHVLAAVKQ